MTYPPRPDQLSPQEQQHLDAGLSNPHPDVMELHGFVSDLLQKNPAEYQSIVAEFTKYGKTPQDLGFPDFSEPVLEGLPSATNRARMAGYGGEDDPADHPIDPLKDPLDQYHHWHTGPVEPMR